MTRYYAEDYYALMVMSSGETPERPPCTIYDEQAQRELGAYMLNWLHEQAQLAATREHMQRARIIAATCTQPDIPTELPPAA